METTESARPPRKSIQAKHLADRDVLQAIAEMSVATSASRWDLQERFDFPPKVMDAKLRALERRGLIDGCASAHNCRGDFTLLPAGRDLLG